MLGDQVLAGNLSVPDDADDQELRFRGRIATPDLYSDFSSVASTANSTLASADTSSSSRTPQSPSEILQNDLELSGSSEDDQEKLKVKNVTSNSFSGSPSKIQEQAVAPKMIDVSRIKEKMRKRNVQKKKEPVKYLPPSSSESSESSSGEDSEEDDAEEKRSKSQKEDDLKIARKAGLSPGMIKQTLETYSKFRTPSNFQLVEKKLGSKGQWHVMLSDGKSMHVFVMSNKFDVVMTKIKINSILCVNQIYNWAPEKKREPKQKNKIFLITNFFVPTAQQVGFELIGRPKKFKC